MLKHSDAGYFLNVPRRPAGFFDFVGAAKYEAWEKLRGTDPVDAQEQYVELVRKLGADV